jgi:hypothetical protein
VLNADEWPARISEITGAVAGGEEKADLFGEPSLHIVGAVVLALIEAVGRQLAHAVEPGRHVAAAGMEERIEQIGAGLVDRHEDVALPGAEIVVEVERPLLPPVAEDDGVVEGCDLAQGAAQGRREARPVQFSDHLRQGGMPIQRPFKHLSPQSGAIPPYYPSGGIYKDGRLPQPDCKQGIDPAMDAIGAIETWAGLAGKSRWA